MIGNYGRHGTIPCPFCATRGDFYGTATSTGVDCGVCFGQRRLSITALRPSPYVPPPTSTCLKTDRTEPQ